MEKGIVQTVLSFYKLGVDVEIISSATGLSKKALERIILDASS